MNYLIYSSVRKDNCTDEEIKKILASCKRNNPKRNITGVLVHSDQYFLQYLEGDMKEIMELYNNIKADDRHERVVLLRKGDIEKRHFPSWHMGYKNVESNDIDMLTSASKDEKQLFGDLIKGEKGEHDRALEILVKFYGII